jgi:hypothetical protein
MVNGRTFALGAIGGAGVPVQPALAGRTVASTGSAAEEAPQSGILYGHRSSGLGAAEETAEELAHARNGRPRHPAWASDVVDAAEVPGTGKAGLAAPGEHHLADPVCAVAASARNRQLTRDNGRLRRQFARALGRFRAAGQALEPACDLASARRHQLPASGGVVPAHGQLAVAAGPLWRAGDLSPPAGIARRLLRSKGRGVWSPAVRQLGAAGAGELPWCGDRAPGWGDDAARPGARVCDVSLRTDGARQAAAF